MQNLYTEFCSEFCKLIKDLQLHCCWKLRCIENRFGIGLWLWMETESWGAWRFPPLVLKQTPAVKPCCCFILSCIVWCMLTEWQNGWINPHTRRKSYRSGKSHTSSKPTHEGSSAPVRVCFLCMHVEWPYMQSTRWGTFFQYQNSTAFWPYTDPCHY